MIRSDITFPSGEAFCAAWLYRPGDASDDSSQTRLIIVMAHGLGGVREMGLDAFAERFADAGYICLVFDYRYFGASGGAPRQLLSIRRQREDWKAAIAYARTVDGADPDRLIIWGTSFGGGHVMATAADDPSIAAAVAQCPFTSGLASSLAIPTLTAAKIGVRAVRDVVASLRGKDPVMVPAYAGPGETALMSAPDVVAGRRRRMRSPHPRGLRPGQRDHRPVRPRYHPELPGTEAQGRDLPDPCRCLHEGLRRPARPHHQVSRQGLHR